MVYRFTFLIIVSTLIFLSSFSQVNQRFESRRSGNGGAAINFFQDNLMNKYNINHLKLDLKVTPNTTFIAGSCHYKMSVIQPIDTFAIEFKDNMTLDSVIINSEKRVFSRNADHIYVVLPSQLQVGSQLNASFYYSGSVINGLAYGNDTASGLIYAATISESFQAREWFPAKQLLNDKIDSTDIWLTTPGQYVAGSNGLLMQVLTLPNGSKQYRWNTKYPMNYYMPCFGVGNYQDYRNYAKPAGMNGDSILVQNLITTKASYFNTIKSNLDKTPSFIEKFSSQFGLYPFSKEKYGHLHGFIGGGMERQTMSTMSSFGLDIISHELGHQWFGDNVICANWQEIWLNEGFAAYCEYLARESFPTYYGTTAASKMSSVHASVMSQLGGSVFVPAASAYDEGRIFSSRLSYDKGSAVIHNLRFEMQNDSLFFTTLKNYQTRYKDSFANTNDFKLIAEQVSGKNLTNFFNQWIYGQGYPTFSVGYYKWGADTLILNVSQTTSAPTITPLFTGLMEYRIRSAFGDTIVLVNHTAANQTFRIPYKNTPSAVVIDPNNWVINKVGSVLPVKFVDFSATLIKAEAKLNWTIAEEINVHHYEIERSVDGTNFYKIGIVGINSQSGTKQYTFTDKEPLSVGFYRIKIVDNDGSFTYSNIVSLKGNPLKVVMFYDAITGNIRARVNSAQKDKMQMSAFTVDGRKVFQREKVIPAGLSDVDFSIASFVKGVYIIEISTNGEREVLKINR